MYKSLIGERLLSQDLKLYEIVINVIDDEGFLNSVVAYKRSDKITIWFKDGSEKIIDEYTTSKSDVIDEAGGIVEVSQKLQITNEIQEMKTAKGIKGIKRVFGALFKESVKQLPPELRPDEALEELLEEVFKQNALRVVQETNKERAKENKKTAK